MELSKKPTVSFNLMADQKEELEKAILWVNASSGSDFSLVDFKVDGMGLATISVSNYELPWLFLLGTYYEKFKHESIELNKLL